MAKTLGNKLREVLNQAVELVNYIKTRPVKSLCLSSYVAIWTHNIGVCFCTLRPGGFPRGKYLIAYMSFDKSYLSFLKK